MEQFNVKYPNSYPLNQNLRQNLFSVQHNQFRFNKKQNSKQTNKKVRKIKGMLRNKFEIKDVKGVSMQIKQKFVQVLQRLQLDLRVQNNNRQQSLQKMQREMRKLCYKVNEFSNLLLQDDFTITQLQDHPLILTRYCDFMFSLLIRTLHQSIRQRNFPQSQKMYNQNSVYQVVAALRLQNFDLKQKISSLQNKLLLSKQRADCMEEMSSTIRQKSEQFLRNYQENFAAICDLLKRAENTQLDLLQSNRMLKEQLQSLQIQFGRYREYFKTGPTLKEKQLKIKNQLEKDYQFKLKNTIKQLETTIKSQMERSLVEKFHVKRIKNIRN